jgi:predicted ATP-dependent endonuclease of OLD family
MNDPIRIHGLEVENFKRISIVRLQPSAAGLTVIGGRNGQGKTSILDAIAAALGGSKKTPTNLRRDGGMADPRVRLELDNGLVIERKGKNFDLHIKAKDGTKGGQKTLDNIIGEFSIDVPKFMAMKSAEKGEHLLQLLGIGDQLKALDKEEQAAYNEREIIGRQARQKDAAAKELPEYPDAPDELLTVDSLMESNRALMRRNAERSTLRQTVATLLDSIKTHESRVASAKLALEQAENDLAAVKSKLAIAQSKPITPDESDAEIKAELANIEATNAKVRANLDKMKAKDDAKAAYAEYEKFTVKIEDVRKRRSSLLDSAAMPLPGLTVEKGELLYNGKAWDCMATSEQIKVAIAIDHALKPSCAFVLLDRLEAFDLDMLREIDAWLAELGMQGIATRVSTGKECSVIIEDGRIEGQEGVIAAPQVEVTEEASNAIDEEPL